MADVGIVLDKEFARLADRLERLADLKLGELLDLMGSEVENQTRRRIESEKTDPEGSPWPEWSERYAATRRNGKKLLEGEGDLLDSITFEVGADDVVIGTNLIYGAIHQFGGEEVGIPIEARPYLGLSSENKDDVLALLDDWLDEQLEAV